jgi:hypothetical protein
MIIHPNIILMSVGLLWTSYETMLNYFFHSFSNLKITLNSITFVLLVQKLQKNKNAHCVVEGKKDLMVCKGLTTWSHPN